MIFNEESLRKRINMGLGSQGIWTPELEEIMFNEISNQSLSDVPPERTMELCKSVMDYLGSKLNGDFYMETNTSLNNKNPTAAKPLLAAGWIDATNQKPKCNEKFSESEEVLCWTKTNTFFVGWYNEKLEQWFVSHFLAESVPLSYDNVPVFWMELPSPPACS